jgi:hypothetical protein
MKPEVVNNPPMRPMNSAISNSSNVNGETPYGI